jgi:hypothetical protein
VADEPLVELDEATILKKAVRIVVGGRDELSVLTQVEAAKP